MDHRATIYLLQDEGMEYGQHTSQSQQPVSEKIFSTSVHHFASGPHWSPMQHPPGKGGIQWNWQHSVLQFQETPELRGSSTSSSPTNAPNSTKQKHLRLFKIYKTWTWNTNWRQVKRSIQKDEARRNTEVKENYTTVKVLHCTSHLWTLYLKFTN